MIAAGESSIHRFRVINNGQDIVVEVFNFSTHSGRGKKKTSKQVAVGWNAIGTPQNLSLPSFSSPPTWTLLDAKNITEINTGKNIVCALLSSCQENQLSFFIVTINCDNKLVPLKYIKVCKQILEASFHTCKPQLIDGPGLMWVHNTSLHVATSSYGPVCRLTLNSKSLEDPSDEKSVKTHLSMLFYHHFQGMSLVVGTRINDDEKNNNKSFAVIFSVPVDSFKNVDNSRIIPEPYLSTVQHVKVLQCSYTNRIESDKICGENYCLNIRLLTVTSEGYLTEFHSGKLIRCLYLSNINVGISQLTAIPTFEDFSSWFPVIITNEQKACIITPRLTKVHSIIEGFSDVFVDDFLGWGSSQLLLVLLSPTWEPNVLSNHWLLTDFDLCHFTSEPRICHQEDDDSAASRFGTDECPEAVEKALSNKIQLEILALEEKTLLLNNRNDFITNCWRQLLCMQSMKGKHSALSTDKKPGLMSFVEGSNLRAYPATKQAHSSCPLEIIRLWQKIYMDQWIVGVEFRHSKAKFLKNASLLITVSENNDSKPGTISHHSGNSGNFTLCGESFFWKNNSLYSCSAKDYFTVTCVIHPLPALTIHPTRKFLVLLCMHIIHEESQLLEILTYPCGTINFGVQQMIGATLVGSSLLQTDNFLSFHEFEDSACVLNAVQSHCKVHIRSKKSQLTFLEEHLKSLEELSWNPRLKCFLWCSNTGPLVDARLAFNKVQPHDCLLSIFAREFTCTTAIVHFLYSHLPEDVIILPEMYISLAKVSTWLQQLQSHLQSLSKEFSLLEDQSVSSEGKLVTGELDYLTTDLLDQIRHEFDTKKRKITDRHVIDLGKCQTLLTLLEKQKHCLDSLAVIFS